MRFIYLGLLLFSITGLILADYRYKLALFYDRTTTIKAIALCVGLFLLWDIAGIGFGIFFIGNGDRYMTGLHILPEMPVEEILFLILLCYNSLLLWRKVADR